MIIKWPEVKSGDFPLMLMLIMAVMLVLMFLNLMLGIILSRILIV